jgi:hypothetical protein
MVAVISSALWVSKSIQHRQQNLAVTEFSALHLGHTFFFNGLAPFPFSGSFIP